VLDKLLASLGVAAADPLLDALARAENGQTRRVVIERLIRLGPEAAPAMIRRLDDERWFVTRNMLTLLSEMPVLPPDFDPTKYVSHPDGRVRREALRVLLRSDATRDRAICLGLADSDDHCVRLALTGAARSCPEAAVPLLLARAVTGTNVDQRVAAIRVAATTGHPAALETLLQITAPRRRLLRTTTPPKSKEYLTALSALSRFASDPRAREALAVAARSRDSEIAQAAVRSTREGDAA
jgi:HEAT repeat protein